MIDPLLADFLVSLKECCFDDVDSELPIEIDTRAVCGDYPIHWAVIQNNKRVVELMLESGVDINILGEEDYTPLDYAVLLEHAELAIYLESQGGRKNRE